MKVLILGSKGQLGSCLNDQLATSDYQVILSSRQEIDVINFTATSREILDIGPDIVINCSAYTAVEEAETDFETANLVNNLAVENLAKVCSEIKSILIHVSTDYVYDGKSNLPYKENHQTNPINRYGETKLLGDMAIQRSKVKHIIIRTGWVFSEYGNNFMKTILKLRNQEKEISVINDQHGCPTYAQDIALLIKTSLGFIEAGECEYGLYHFSGAEACTWYEFAKAIHKAANLYEKSSSKIIPVTSENFFTQAKRPKYSVLDNNKIKKAFNVSSSDWKRGVLSVLSTLQI